MGLPHCNRDVAPAHNLALRRPPRLPALGQGRPEPPNTEYHGFLRFVQQVRSSVHLEGCPVAAAHSSLLDLHPRPVVVHLSERDRPRGARLQVYRS